MWRPEAEVEPLSLSLHFFSGNKVSADWEHAASVARLASESLRAGCLPFPQVTGVRALPRPAFLWILLLMQWSLYPWDQPRDFVFVLFF